MAIDISDQDYRIWKSQFKDMIRRYEGFMRRYGREPRIIYVDSKKRMYITAARFKEMLERWNKYTEEHGREPNYIRVLPPTPLKIGYWLRYADMRDFNAEIAAAKGCSEVFLSSKSLDHPEATRKFIDECSKHGIRPHAWIQCLYRNGTFIPPTNADNVYRVKEEITRAVRTGFQGVHFDYIRYPGLAPADGFRLITRLAYELRDHTKQLKPEMMITAAVMPEMEANARHYGQCYKCLAPYVDVQIPMAYKGNYGAERSWIQRVTRYVIQESGRIVWTGLQAYRSDRDPFPIPRSELEADIRAAYASGAQKVIIFRFGLSNI